jgi:hypothetical protein
LVEFIVAIFTAGALSSTMTMTTSLFTQIKSIEASSIPRPGTAEYKAYLDDLVAAAKTLIESTTQWKSKGIYDHVVEVRERMDWRGSRNWFLRRSVHKDVSFETFRVRGARDRTLMAERVTRESYRE